ncbi:MAG: hypothetical protein AAFX44_07495 [Pseudomonadota bacterium]
MASLKRFGLATFLLLAMSSVFAQEQPLIVDAEPAWDIEYFGDKVPFYSLTRQDNGDSQLMFHRWPVRGSKEQIPTLLGDIAQRFAEEMGSGWTKLVIKDGYALESIAGNEFSGEAAIFSSRLGFVQTMFMISDGDGLWFGQFNGPKAMWSEAVAVLNNLQRNPG